MTAKTKFPNIIWTFLKILTCDNFETTAKMWRVIVPSQILGFKVGKDFPTGNKVIFAIVEALKQKQKTYIFIDMLSIFCTEILYDKINTDGYKFFIVRFSYSYSKIVQSEHFIYWIHGSACCFIRTRTTNVLKLLWSMSRWSHNTDIFIYICTAVGDTIIL